MEEKRYTLELTAQDLNIIGNALNNLQVPVKEAPIVQGLLQRMDTQFREQVNGTTSDTQN